VKIVILLRNQVFGSVLPVEPWVALGKTGMDLVETTMP